MKAAGLLSFTAAIATRAAVQSHYTNPEDGVFAIDACLAAAFTLLAKSSKAKWLGWCAGLQVMTVLTHLARLTLTDVPVIAYFEATAIWSFPVMVLILGAACISPEQQQRESVALVRSIPEIAERHGKNVALEEVSLVRDLIAMSGSTQVLSPSGAHLVRSFGGLGQLLDAPALVLKDAGVGDKVIDIFHLCRRATRQLARGRLTTPILIAGAGDVVDYLRVECGHAKREEFRVFYLDAKNFLIDVHLHGIGTVAECPVYPREIVALALKLHATSVILSHNHPSGDCTPSRPDITITSRIYEAVRTIDVHLHDHIIVSDSGWKSFVHEGLMDGIRYKP